ncbi:MAG TPA: helix-turn-helix domain-containing protein, partial [Defluviitaleaceae bacterium]|nr:helix-turn-helix domain-containing protein [Defluviitaleaceae bacterium]
MLFAKKYETFDEMNKLYNMHFEAKETKMYLRTRMIMLSWDGYTVPEIGRILDIHPHTVRHWIKQYNERGINGLYDAEKPVPQPLY